MKKVIIFLPKGQTEYTTEDDILQIADYVYANYPDNLGFKVEDLEVVRKLRSKQWKRKLGGAMVVMK